MGGSLIEHPEALRSLDLLVRALWQTHDFMVDGRVVNEMSEVMDAFREDRLVSFTIRDTLK